MKHNMLILFVAGILFHQGARAGDFRSGGTVTIETPQYKDLYISAGTVIINAPIHGDVIIAGGNVTINDSVMNDLVVAGGNVTVNGYVGDDVRCAGGELTLNTYIEGDLIGAGGRMYIRPKASAASIVVSGGELEIDGSSRGSLKAAGGTITFNGNVNEDADLRGGKIYINGQIGQKATLGASSEIVISDKARVGRSIRYWLPFNRPLKVPAGVTAANPVYDPLLSITYSRWYFLGASTLLGLLWYLGMAYVLILLLLYLFPALFERAGSRMQAKPFVSGLWGLAVFVGVPLAVVVLLITIVGVPVALLLAVSYIAVLLMATILSSVVITHWVENISERQWNLWHKSGIALFTFTLLKILAFTPFFGSFIMALIAAVAIGSIVTSIRWKRHARVYESNRRILVT